MLWWKPPQLERATGDQNYTRDCWLAEQLPDPRVLKNRLVSSTAENFHQRSLQSGRDQAHSGEIALIENNGEGHTWEDQVPVPASHRFKSILNRLQGGQVNCHPCKSVTKWGSWAEKKKVQPTRGPAKSLRLGWPGDTLEAAKETVPVSVREIASRVDS